MTTYLYPRLTWAQAEHLVELIDRSMGRQPREYPAFDYGVLDRARETLLDELDANRRRLISEDIRRANGVG